MVLDSHPTAILAIDPGGKTGWAAYGAGPPANGFRGGEIGGDFEHQAGELGELFYKYTPAIVVCETYTITARTAQLSQQHEALMLIGMVRWFVSRSGAQLFMQKPGTAKTFSTDSKLRAMNWWTTTPGGHANDAARHLLVWLASNGRLDNDTLKKLAEAA